MRVFAVVLAALVLCPAATGAANLGAMARQLVKAGAPGAIVYVRTPTRTRAGVAGYADRAAHVSMRAADRFRIASLTKAFVSVVVLQLEAEGKLDIDDPVAKSLPGVVPNGGAITLRELMSHTSGLFNYTDDAAFNGSELGNFSHAWSPQELLAIAFSHPPTSAPGATYSYSNTNYVVLGLVVEAVTGKPLGQLLQERIFTPLGLASTSFPATIVLAPDFVHGYFKFPDTPLLDATPGLSPSWGWAAGGIVSNSHDVTAFYRGLLTGKLLPAVQLKEMETPISGTYALGIDNSSPSCGRAFTHNGDYLAWRTIVYSTANGKRQAVVMVNVNDTYVPWDRLNSFAQKALCKG